jgi:hypothetical protein
VLTTGVIFGSIVLAHVWRVAAESPLLARDPFFVIVTLVCAALCVWALRLVRTSAPAARSRADIG